MLHENIKECRKNKGMTQEELAIRLNVVRQTVSKWEKGLSVPDADALQKLAEVLEIPVCQLLGAAADRESDRTGEIALQLARLNDQLAIQNRRRKRIWRVFGIIFGSVLGLWLLNIILAMIFSFAGPVVTHEVITHETEYEQVIAPTE